MITPRWHVCNVRCMCGVCEEVRPHPFIAAAKLLEAWGMGHQRSRGRHMLHMPTLTLPIPANILGTHKGAGLRARQEWGDRRVLPCLSCSRQSMTCKFPRPLVNIASRGVRIYVHAPQVVVATKCCGIREETARPCVCVENILPPGQPSPRNWWWRLPFRG
jgi:hypothetical protein